MTTSTPLPEQGTDTNQASEDELQPFTSLFQNAAVARDYISGCMSEEDINELAAHIFFIEPTYKYDISKEPIDNVFSAYRIAVKALLRNEKLKLLAEVRERVIEQAKPDKRKANSWQQGIEVAAYEDAVRVYEYKMNEQLTKLEAEL